MREGCSATHHGKVRPRRETPEDLQQAVVRQSHADRERQRCPCVLLRLRLRLLLLLLPQLLLPQQLLPQQLLYCSLY